MRNATVRRAYSSVAFLKTPEVERTRTMKLVQQVTLTWDDLIVLEPFLGQLLAEIEAVHDDPTERYFCANELWYGYNRFRGCGFKQSLSLCVGRHRDNHELGFAPPELCTSTAYDVAYEKLYNALPDCRNCLCMKL